MEKVVTLHSQNGNGLREDVYKRQVQLHLPAVDRVRKIAPGRYGHDKIIAVAFGGGYIACVS